MSRHASCHSKKNVKKSKIPIRTKTNKVLVTAAEMVAVQDDMKNIKMGQTEINKNFGTFDEKVSEIKDDLNEVLRNRTSRQRTFYFTRSL